MTSAYGTDHAQLPRGFASARPATVAAGLGDANVHLWRMPHLRSERRAPLRRLLATYLGTTGADVAFVESATGKPRIARTGSSGSEGHLLEFNWSHSGQWALVALARGQAVGVDVERLGKPVRAVELARRFFDPTEADAIAALSGQERDQAFICLWCAKEAVLKAAGKGLSFGLDRLAFERRDVVEWGLSRVDLGLGDIRDWRLASFDAAPGYRGALAWHGAPREVRAFQAP